MAISITIQIGEEGLISPMEQRVLDALSSGGGAAVEQPTPAPKAEPKSAKAEPKKAEPKEKPKAEPKVDAKPDTKAPTESKPEPKSKPAEDKADSGSGEDKLQEAVDAATALVTSGKTSVVKAALATAGAKRVSELKKSNVQQFLDELSKEG